MLVLVDDGLDMSTYPSGVPTSVSVPAIDQTTTDPVTVAGSDTTSITLLNTPIAGTVVVEASVPRSATTTSASSVAAGSVVVTPAVMEPYIVVGANLEINEGQSDQEIVTVSAVTTTTFMATFALAHNDNFTIAPAKTLVAGTDYTLGTDASGNTTINFINTPAAGTTISTTYSFVQQPATITLNFGGLPAGTTSVTEIEGNVSVSVGGFASLSADLAIEKYTPASGDPVLMIGATNVDAVLGTTDTNVTVTGASFGLLVQDGNYALLASGGTIALNGVPDLSLTATSLQV